MILGMNWLSRHQVVVDCRMKRVTLRTPSGEEVTFIGKWSNHISNVKSIATARTMVRKGCEAYLAYVIDTKMEEPSLLDTPIVCDYSDVFPEELLGLPPHREIDFAIEVVPGATPGLSLTINLPCEKTTHGYSLGKRIFWFFRRCICECSMILRTIEDLR